MIPHPEPVPPSMSIFHSLNRLIPHFAAALTISPLCAAEAVVSASAPIPVPAEIKAYDIDFNWGPGGPNGFAKPGLWAEADPAAHVAWYKSIGCNVIQSFCVSCNGYAWYKNGVVAEQPGLKHDFLPEMVKLAHQENMLVFGYFCAGANTRWGQTQPALSYGFPSEPHIPYTDEYLAYLDLAIRDAVKMSGMDGFMVDWLRMPTTRKSNGNRWLDCEKKLYTQLTRETFPGEDKITPAQMTAYGRLAVDRAWQTIRKAAKATNPDCLVWLTCCDVNDPHIADSRALKETDWLLNEAGDIKRTNDAKRMIGPQTRLVTCLALWNGQDPGTVVPDAKKNNTGLYGFTKPTQGNLKPPASFYLGNPVTSFKGDDRNIAALARAYLGLPQELVQPDTANTATWTNALKPAGIPKGEIAITAEGKALARIVLPEHPTPRESAAADQLQHWLKEMTGVSLVIRSDPAPAGEAAIILKTDPALGTEGYAIDLSDNQLVLSGGTGRGMVNAVFALLEEDLGWRYYTADSVRIPKTGKLIIAPVARRYVPKLKLRDPFYRCAFDPMWSLCNRTNAPRAAVPEDQGGRIDYADMFVHTAAKMVPPSRYFKDHPEYFAQKADGTHTAAQLCPTNPDVVKIVTDCVRQTLGNHPETEIVSVSKNDSTLSCLCPRCVKLRQHEGSDMANQLFLVNQVANAIEDEFPMATISTLAYLDTIQVPKSVRPAKNVAIRLCNDNAGSWRHPFTPARSCDIAKIAGAWSAAHKRIHVWDYNVNFSHYLAPMPNIDIMADNIRFWVKNHAEAVMLQGAYQGPGEQDQLKSWVTAKLLWNPDWDENALVRDFILGHYGKAAPALMKYQELLGSLRGTHAAEMKAPKGGIRYTMDASFLTRGFVDNGTGLFAEARRLATGDKDLLDRVDRAELPLLYVRCERGPAFTGSGYPQVVARFETIARRENATTLREGGPDLETKLAGYKKHIP